MDAGNRRLLTFYPSEYTGGAETLLLRMVSYSVKRNRSISMFSIENDFVFRNLNDKILEKIDMKLLDPSILMPIMYMEDKDYNSLSHMILGETDCCTFDTFVYAPYFNNLQASMLIFDKSRNLKLFTAFLHPEAWPRALFSWPSVHGKSIRPLRKNSIYYYQRELLRKLDLGFANWFMNDVTKKYHEYYYDVELPNSRVIPLPFDIPEIDPVFFDKARKNRGILKVLWLGRFEYFKNPSIKKTYEALQQLVEKHKELNVEFDLIGYGSEKYEKDIRKQVKTSGRLQVKYLGKVFPDKLPEVIAQYDVGVAMGTSALHIGGMRIPSILVDASDEKHISQIKGCWLHEAPVGFLGEGVYADICGYTVEVRRDLLTLFEEFLELGTRSEIVGSKCYEYTLENYDENKIMPQIIDAWTSSTFSPGDMEVYRHPPIKRFIRRTAKKILRR